MAAIPHYTWEHGSPITISAGGTRYFHVGSGPDNINSNTTEAPVALPWRVAGTFSKLLVWVATNDRTTNSSLTFRKNTADGSQTVSITAATTGQFQDTTNTDSVSAGDTVDAKVVVGTGGTTFSIQGLGVLFSATSDTAVRFVVSWAGASIIDGALINLCGTRVTSADETQQSGRALVAGTVKNWAIRINSNSRNGATTFASRVNAVDGNGSISVASSTTGNFEDTTNSDTVAVDDNFCVRVTLGGTSGTMGMYWAARDLVTTNGKAPLMANGASGNIGFGVTRYCNPSGAVSGSWATTEGPTQEPALMAITVSRLTTYLPGNSINGASTLTFRVAGSDTSLAVSITASTTGRFSDDANTASVGNLDLLSLKLVVGGSSGLLNTPQTSFAWGDATTPADQNLTLPYLSSTAALNTPWVAHQQDLSLPTLTGTVVYPPMVGIEQTLDLPTLATGEQVFAPVIEAALGLPTLDSTAVLYAPAQTYEVVLPFRTSTLLVPTPTIFLGYHYVELPGLGVGTLIYPPSLIGIQQSVTLPTYTQSHTYYTPTVDAPSAPGPFTSASDYWVTGAP